MREREKEKVHVQVTAALLIFIQRTRKVTLSSDKCLGLTWKAYVLVKGKETSEGPPLAASICVMDQKIFLDLSCLVFSHLNNFLCKYLSLLLKLFCQGEGTFENLLKAVDLVLENSLSLSLTQTHTLTYNIRNP